ncbi:MAG: hypothetical protein WCW27_03005 [Patescibacteria group bacterium]|jgi:hypothetical protein
MKYKIFWAIFATILLIESIIISCYFVDNDLKKTTLMERNIVLMETTQQKNDQIEEMRKQCSNELMDAFKKITNTSDSHWDSDEMQTIPVFYKMCLWKKGLAE